jgi:hypothetical protein
MARNIINVHKQINDVIPYEFQYIKIDLQEYINNHWNKAPEVLCSSEVYIEYVNILREHISNIENTHQEWIINVLNIFSDKYNCNISQ